MLIDQPPLLLPITATCSLRIASLTDSALPDSRATGCATEEEHLIPDNWRVVHSPAFSLNLVEQVARFLWSTVITRRFVETRVECNGNESATMNGHANVVALRRKRHSLTPLRVGASTLQRRTESARVCYFLPLSSSRGSRACQDSPRSHGTSLSRLRWSRQTVELKTRVHSWHFSFSPWCSSHFTTPFTSIVCDQGEIGASVS